MFANLPFIAVMAASAAFVKRSAGKRISENELSSILPFRFNNTKTSFYQLSMDHSVNHELHHGTFQPTGQAVDR